MLTKSRRGPRKEKKDGGFDGKHQGNVADDSVLVPDAGWNRSIWNPHVVPPPAPLTLEGIGTSPDNKASISGDERLAPWQSTRTRLISPQEEALRQQAVAVVFSRFQVMTSILTNFFRC